MVLGFAASVVVARALGASGRGHLALIMVTMQMLHPLSLLLNGANDILLGKNAARRCYLIKQTLVWNSLLCALLLTTFLGLPDGLLQVLLGSANPMFIGLSIIYLWLLVSENGLRALLMARQEFFYVNVLSIIGTFGYFALLLIGLAMWEGSVTVVLLAVIAQQVFLTCAYLWQLGNTDINCAKNITPKWRRVLLAKSFSIGKRVFLVGVPTLLLLKVDIWILSAYTNTSVVGVYQIAVGVCWLFIAIAGILNRIVKAKAVSERGGAERAALASKLVLFCGIAAYLPLAVFGEQFFLWVYGVEFAESFDSAFILWLAVIFWGWASPIAGYVVAKRHYPLRVVLGMNLALAVNVLLNFLFIPILDQRGAALASVIAYAMMAWTYATEFSHETSISVRRLVILSREEQLKMVTMFKRPRSEEQG
jgi:O-antigen/teichoic acid export membrane protein